jgi:murein L,D-transpeptidase YafK
MEISQYLVMQVKPFLEPTNTKARRAFLSAGLALSASLCFGRLGFAQSGRVRIPTTATGQAAIGRVRGRLEISYDDLGLPYGAPIYLRLIKDQKRLEVWVKGRQQAFVRLRSYRICGSSAILGPRRRGGQPQQPEGFYLLSAASLRPNNVAYLGLDIGWPNVFDRAQGWTGSTSLLQAGCASEPHFGLTDQDLEEVYTLIHGALSNGQTAIALHIFPFDMNGLRMLTARRSPNAAFWDQLQPAWRAFERTKKPPQVRVLGRRYVVKES